MLEHSKVSLCGKSWKNLALNTHKKDGKGQFQKEATDPACMHLCKKCTWRQKEKSRSPIAKLQQWLQLSKLDKFCDFWKTESELGCDEAPECPYGGAVIWTVTTGWHCWNRAKAVLFCSSSSSEILELNRWWQASQCAWKSLFDVFTLFTTDVMAGTWAKNMALWAQLNEIQLWLHLNWTLKSICCQMDHSHDKMCMHEIWHCHSNNQSEKWDWLLALPFAITMNLLKKHILHWIRVTQSGGTNCSNLLHHSMNSSLFNWQNSKFWDTCGDAESECHQSECHQHAPNTLEIECSKNQVFLINCHKTNWDASQNKGETRHVKCFCRFTQKDWRKWPLPACSLCILEKHHCKKCNANDTIFFQQVKSIWHTKCKGICNCIWFLWQNTDNDLMRRWHWFVTAFA